MIRQEEVFRIGHVTKGRGLRGEVEVVFTDDCFDGGTSDCLVLDMDHILVPFFWEEYSFKNNETAIFKFEDIDDEEAARQLVGHDVFYPKCGLPDDDAGGSGVLSSYKALAGFSVYGKAGEYVGEVIAVDDSSANVLMTIRRNGDAEFLMPFHDDFLIDFDLRKRSLHLDIPESLLSLND